MTWKIFIGFSDFNPSVRNKRKEPTKIKPIVMTIIILVKDFQRRGFLLSKTASIITKNEIPPRSDKIAL